MYWVGAHRKRGGHPVHVKGRKMWDGCGTTIRASSPGLAIAALDDGLFEVPRVGERRHRFFDPEDDTSPEREPRQLSTAHASSANWAFTSIYGTSSLGDGYLAAYSWEKIEGTGHFGVPKERLERKFSRLISGEEIFEERGVSWALQDKLYLFRKGKLTAARYRQRYVNDGDDAFERLGVLDVGDKSEKFVSAGVSLFGTIIQTNRQLVVLGSDGSVFRITRPVTRWRVFPRSDRYTNQLHVIFDDCLTIYSFNHDYFVEQDAKVSGVNFKALNPGARRLWHSAAA